MIQCLISQYFIFTNKTEYIPGGSVRNLFFFSDTGVWDQYLKTPAVKNNRGNNESEVWTNLWSISANTHRLWNLMEVCIIVKILYLRISDISLLEFYIDLWYSISILTGSI